MGYYNEMTHAKRASNITIHKFLNTGSCMCPLLSFLLYLFFYLGCKRIRTHANAYKKGHARSHSAFLTYPPVIVSAYSFFYLILNLNTVGGGGMRL